MSDDETIETMLNSNFPIIAADGVHTHFLDGFVSLLFYTTRTIPDEDGDKLKVLNKKEMIADIRLSVNKTKKLVTDLDSGLDLLPLATVWGDVDYFSGKNEGKKDSEELHNVEVDGEEMDAKIAVSIIQEFDKLSKENKGKCMKIVYQAINSKASEIREVIQADQEEKKEEHAESK